MELNMIEERKPAAESGPEFLKISRRNPVAAEEENNFAKITGRTSVGYFFFNISKLEQLLAFKPFFI